MATEPRWSRADVDMVIASRDYEASIGGHGHPLAESTADAANPANPDGDYYYIADKPTVDWAERARDLAAQRFREQAGDQSMAGYFFPVRKVRRQGR